MLESFFKLSVSYIHILRLSYISGKTKVGTRFQTYYYVKVCIYRFGEETFQSGEKMSSTAKIPEGGNVHIPH